MYNVELIFRGNFIIKLIRIYINIHYHQGQKLSDMFLRFVSMDFNVLSPILK
jgi:hypothetical protein